MIFKYIAVTTNKLMWGGVIIANKPKAILIERTIGDDIFETMSSGLAKDYYTSVMEFICNGHDAGAHNFSVVASLDQLIMEDDGTGMNQESLHNFFTKGTDYKRVNPKTKEGRTVLGRFGLATLLLRHLGDAYRLETWQDGSKIIVDQDFTRDGWREPKTMIKKSDEKIPSGTRITITRPRYKFDSDEFNMPRLMSEITWGFPPLHDFNITVNGQELQKRAIVTYGVEYDVTAQISDKVNISGSIFYNTSRGKERLPFNNGIILYVNGRRVGDPQEFALASIDRRFPRGILGLIDVYGLSNKIRFDRSGFLRTPEYLSIKEYIATVLQSIRTDLDSGFGNRRFYGANKAVHYVEQSLDAAEQRLNLKLKLEGENQYTLEFDTGGKSGPVARVDHENKIIYINQSNPQLIRSSKKRLGKTLENILIMTTLVAIAEHEVIQKYGRAAQVFSKLNKLFSKNV